MAAVTSAVMRVGAPGAFAVQLKALREAAGFTQEELATIAGLSVHAVSALERGERRRPQVETVRALSAALDLTATTRDALLASARSPAQSAAVDELSAVALPLAPTVLLGREVDVQTLRQWIADPTARLITLTGPGGVGKTRLALELARSIAAEGTARVVFVALAAVWNAPFVASAIAEALGLSDVTPLDLPTRARIACGDQPTLLVLDNFEQVLDAAPIVAELLTSVASLRVLATSRSSLRLRGEREYSVGPLALNEDATSPADLVRSPAVRLFVERVRDVRPDFRLTTANGPTVAAICRRLDALPLALELAAPWLKVLTAEDLLNRLAHDVLLSAVGPRDLPERQQTMNATVAWSYQLLAPEERRAFRRLSALAGRYPIEAAVAVLVGSDASSASGEGALLTLAGLIDKSLLLRAEVPTATRPLYQTLETVRAFAALELAASGESDDALAGLARYCLDEATLAAGGLIGAEQAEWLERVRDNLENYRGALSWLIERGRADQAADIACGLMWFWVIRGHTAEGLRWYEEILGLSSLAPRRESRTLAGAARMSYTQGDLTDATGRLNRVLTLAESVGDIDTVAQAENQLGHIERKRGNLSAARDRFARSFTLFRARSIEWGAGSALHGLAIVALATGDVARAEDLLDEATLELRNAGPWFLTLGAYARGVLAVRRGNANEAITVMRESLTDIRELHDRFAFVYALVPLAAAAVLKGDDAWAARILGARNAVTDRTGATVVDKAVDDLRDQAEREARARLGADRWARAYAAGRVSSIDSLIKDIDTALSVRARS
jgi:predicted ATPase/DNA-binding XRE family transcriptional regulator